MNVMDTDFFKKYIDMADDGDRMGWHERNGGNFTYWIKQEEIESIRDELSKEGKWMPIGTCVKDLAKEYFLISGTGKYFHNMKKDPMHTVGIIEIDETGEQYRICWGLLDGGKPTSEMPTHLMNLEVRKNMTNSEERVIYHAHCPNLIALTFLLPLKDEVFTRELWEMMTECPVIFPEGVGVVKWMVPGGKDIAVATSKKMENYRAVIWAHHGLFCSGIDFDSTFGLMHTIEKSAEIYIKVHSVQTKKAQSITPDDFRQLAKEFHVTLNERFLYEK
ncbi:MULTISPECIES: rhamnulose-1-phosphate aldolase [Bacillota]|uniref:Rhamnulose-1-phosphate aldolase n=2 Tax=Amedibacillus TaxID=2749846 RepID=A0A7G9GIP4_9FIRM|nr:MULTISPECIES: rhamnulose-1-phosphate aldolase [Bacillota]QNM10676.1 rhamnulose-1-phosphate aldolase [[Eubacterium] hominis]MCH4285632.1 rhamnulose-1-phosphate aldolase [Amedibacillus hominis]RGB54016.1 rhamnulose-1-phosphate aldolase [Absiella sp. AM22-9]RGB61225.1 rhamnulose-1-phosphate aldolase [Absiella sp. AM10-20]RGB64627.1 rhamnulose-1-phosphate aldolase [Absiella sp. AM09-45]